MSSKAICIRETLYSAIRSVSAVSWLFARSPGRDFTRNVKLPFAKLITLILSLKGSSITCELMEHFGCTKTLVSEPAFVKRRGRLLPEALETIFRLFVENTRPSNRYKGFQLLAVDGSDLHTPTNPDDTASFIPGSGGQKPYNLKHLNALYDLCSHIYMDAVVQGRHQYDERRALCDMVDRANTAYPAIIIADRGYESYNVFAHIQEKGWKFLIRVKDRSSNGIVNGLELPAQDEFDVPIRLALSRKQTNKFKGLLGSKNEFKQLRNYTFDYLPMKNKKGLDIPPYIISFRVVRFKLSDSSFETVLTNLDFPPDELKQLYAMRWGIETSFRELKYTIGLSHFHAKRPDFILQEIFARLTMYNFSELISMSVVIERSGNKYAYRANFSAAAHICRNFFLGRVAPTDLEALIARFVSPIRPGRASPRHPTVKYPVSFLYRLP